MSILILFLLPFRLMLEARRLRLLHLMRWETAHYLPYNNSVQILTKRGKVNIFPLFFQTTMNEKIARTIDELRQQAKKLHVNERLLEAIHLQLKIIDIADKSGALRAEDYHWLGVMLVAVRDFPNAAIAFKMVFKLDRNFLEVFFNLVFCLTRADRHGEALTLIEISKKPISNDDPDWLLLMAEIFWKTGNREISRQYGEKCLLLKDKIACQQPHPAIHLKRAPRFRPDCPEQNIISFSLFGDQERYLTGAVKNVMAAKEYYPGWRCRFYCDDRVPKKTLSDIAQGGGQVKMMPRPQCFADGLFWRFLVAEDPTVVRFLVRDADSVVNKREQYAVNEWLMSGKPFHIMRDGYLCLDLILAGMWGGITGVLPYLATLLKGFAYDPVKAYAIVDQIFLGDRVWPLIKENCLIHDSIYRVFNAMDFPPGSELPPGRLVGDNDFAFSSDPNFVNVAAKDFRNSGIK